MILSRILVQYALCYFLSETSERESVWFKSLKNCLREKFQLYFDEKISQYQKDVSLVSCKSDIFYL